MEFLAFVETTHREKHARETGSGDRWIQKIMRALDHGCIEYDSEMLQVQLEALEGDLIQMGEEATPRTEPTEAMLGAARVLYLRMADLADPVESLQKQDLGLLDHDGSEFDM